MSVVNLRESVCHSRVQWQGLLGSGSEVVENLLNAGVLRPQPDKTLCLTFVGLIVFDDRILISRPKFSSDPNYDLPSLVRVLTGYFARSALRRAISDDLRSAEFSDGEVLREYDALLGLRDWFGTHGLYRREQGRRTFHGRPNWARTLARQAPLLVQGAVVYPRVESEHRHGVINDITALQVEVTESLSAKYGLVAPMDLRRAGFAAGHASSKWPLSPEARQYSLRRLALEQRDQFQTHNLTLLRLLREILDSQLATRTHRPTFFGTTAFYSVWEDACRVLMDGLVDPSAMLGQPEWGIVVDGGVRAVPLEQRPDIVVSNAGDLFIMDAKYYFPFPQSMPGAPDIIKQIYYAEALRSHAYSSIRSIFLFPCHGCALPKFMGLASVRGSAREFPYVEAWGIDPAIVFAQYPSTAPSVRQEMVQAIVSQKGHVTAVSSGT